MSAAMKEIIAIITIMVWPVVPLFWIPVHGLSAGNTRNTRKESGGSLSRGSYNSLFHVRL